MPSDRLTTAKKRIEADELLDRAAEIADTLLYDLKANEVNLDEPEPAENPYALASKISDRAEDFLLEEIVNAYEMIDNAIGAAEEKLGALALAKLRDDAQWPFGGKLPTTFSMKNGPATEEEKGAADDR